MVLLNWASACGPLPINRATPTAGATVYVVDRGWHTEIGLSVQDITGPLAGLRQDFPGVRYLVFGFGDRRYLLSRDTTFFDMLRAMFPGRAAMLVTALRASPSAAFGDANVFALGLPRAGAERLSQFVWASLGKDRRGKPSRIADGPYPGSVFYASTGTYDATHTCNTWVAEGLHASGLSVDAPGIVFAAQVVALARLPAPSPAAADLPDKSWARK